jgi:putative ABC transport system permease protein
MNPVGRKVRTNDSSQPPLEVVGVVADTRLIGLEREPVMMAYTPYWQTSRARTSILVKSSMDSEPLAKALRAAIREVDADAALAEIRPMQSVVDQSIGRRRFQMTLTLGFAAFALLLASLGVYGVVAYWVARRRAELGIRLALGAGRGRISAMVLRQGLAPVGGGMAAGLALALAGGRVVESLLFGVKASEPVVYCAVALTLGGLAVAACALPAWRAARLEAMEALRYE